MKAETVRQNHETGTTDFRSATFGFVHAAITIDKADHPLAAIYEAIRDGFQARSRSDEAEAPALPSPTRGEGRAIFPRKQGEVSRGVDLTRTRSSTADPHPLPMLRRLPVILNYPRFLPDRGRPRT